MSPVEAARAAIDWHSWAHAPGEPYRSCRLFDGEDSGPPERRCWLVPGHQCDCMTEAEVRRCVQEDDFGVVLIHPETDPLYTRVTEILLAREAIALASNARIEEALAANERHNTALERLLETMPTPESWHIQPLPPSPYRAPTHARHGGQCGDKAARKAQKQARKANRSRK